MNSDHKGIGACNNYMLMSTPRTTSAPGAHDIGAENWMDEDVCDKGAATMDSKSNELDWVHRASQ